MSKKAQFSLESKYTQEEGTIVLTGLQALVRLPIDQHRADQKAGLNTGTFISGYRGSPVGGLDFLLEQNANLLQERNIHFEPGVNEDLAETAVFGSQFAHTYPQPQFDGVVGMWYGKGPGVDRTGDIFRHANLAGVQHTGGVLAIAGDDPFCKSSTIPSHSEVALYDAQMPVLYPGNVQEVIEYGRFGFELSRYTGLWAGFKFVTNIADGFASADISPIEKIERPVWEFDGKPWRHTQNSWLLAPGSLMLEREIHFGRLEAASRFAYANGLNQIKVSSNADWIGLVATGKTYYDLREALNSVGLDDAQLRRYGIRLLKIGMISPLEPTIVKEFARGLQEIFVVEEKRGFLELLLRDVLYNETERPLVVGKQDEHGQFLIKGHSELTPDELVPLLASRLSQRVPETLFAERLRILQGPAPSITLSMAQPAAARTPYFCSGCPHNRSTVIPEGSVAGGGIGCHSLTLLMPGRQTLGLTQMGGEGAQWVGAQHFTNTKHIFQNIGDGTLFHSGYMAVRQAVAAKATVTYKILFNGAVAMTGGQQADGEMNVPELTRALHAEGTSRILVVSHDVDKYGDATFAPGVDIWDRDRLDEAQDVLKETEGVSILIYDQPCATELRRQRKRGKVENPPERIFINEAVCEGCGDCGVKSNCLSVFPVETEFGRKTQIHQSSCNKDYTCLDGNCPAFIKVTPSPNQSQAASYRPTEYQILDTDLPEPRQLPPREANLFMTGIGGTGVVTTTQILATAAIVDGKQINSLDQTGLSQKGGPVVSHLKITENQREESNLIGAAAADAYIVFDVLSGTTDKNLSHAHPERSVAVVSSSKIPTGQMVKNKAIKFPEGAFLKQRVEAYTQADKNVYLDAIKLSENIFGGHMQANMITIGAAFQAGLIPISSVAIEFAIELNGVKVDENKLAFRVGRKVVAKPSWEPILGLERVGAQELVVEISAEARTIINSVGASGELLRLLEVRVPELIAYQNAAYAQQYADFVRHVAASEPGNSTELSEAVARYLFKLMAYKDEYEVARLQLRPELDAAIASQFGSNARIQYQLQPPIFKHLGLRKKIGLGKWFDAGFKLLASMKGLRGTTFDIFGYDEVRRTERELIGNYRDLIQKCLSHLTVDNYADAVKLAELPDMIRGYDEVKLANVAAYRQAVNALTEKVVLGDMAR
ncbi:MAG: indolepyruvate ferredoxin oxidoreductase family protein [Chloroflexota bacterium]